MIKLKDSHNKKRNCLRLTWYIYIEIAYEGRSGEKEGLSKEHDDDDPQ